MYFNFAVAYVTDRSLFMPTIRSAHSMLTHASRPLRLLFVGLDLDPWMLDAIELLQRQHSRSMVEVFQMPREWLKDATSPKGFITPTALGRMFLPRITDGRVLYIDGDTLVTGDVTKAASIDLGANAIAGVRDYNVMSWIASGKSSMLKRQSNILGGSPDLKSYINSGVLLMDCDVIRATAGLQSEMEDMVAATGYPTVDQDRINAIFSDRIAHLDPAWNCSWGRLSRQRRHARDLPSLATADRPIILHYHGPNKPWHAPKFKTLKRGALSMWRYRRAMAEFQQVFPDLPLHR